MRVCAWYRHFRHPDRFGLLVADLVLQTLVPSVGAGLHVDARWKEEHQEPVRKSAWSSSEELWMF